MRTGMWSPFQIGVDDKSRVVNILLIPIPVFIVLGSGLGGANLVCVERQSQHRA